MANKLTSIEKNLKNQNIFHSKNKILGKPTVIGYDKQFRWSWMATQLNTFIIATDFGSTKLTEHIIKDHINESFNFAENNYKGWPRGMQSGLGAISILISSNIDKDAKDFCTKLKSGKRFGGFSIPVIINSSTGEIFKFERSPMWGGIYFSYFKELIEKIT